MNKSAKDSMESIQDFINTVDTGQEKQALGSDGSVAHTEPGSQGGETSHPVKNVDDRTEDASTGFRHSENAEDVKEDQGEPSVDSTEEAKAKVAMEAGHPGKSCDEAHPGKSHGAYMKKANEGTAADDQLQIGTNVQATGDDPATETDSTKSTKEDDGYDGSSSHPARTDNDAIDGHKWADDLANQPLDKLAGMMQDLGNDLCASIAVSSNTKQAQAPAQAAAAQQALAQPAPAQTKQAADHGVPNEIMEQAGWEMASLITNDGSFDKKAADSLVKNTLTEIIKVAGADADRVIVHLDEFLKKQAMPMPEGAENAEDGGEAALPPSAVGEEGGDEAALMGALGGEEPPAAGPEMGGETGGGMGGGDEAAQLAAILQELGVTPQELQAAMAAEAGGGLEGAPPGMGGEEAPPGVGGEGVPPGMGGEGVPPGLGGGGGAPPGLGGGGAPPGMPPGLPPGLETAAADNGVPRAEKFAGMRQYINEVVGRSRAKQAQAQPQTQA